MMTNQTGAAPRPISAHQVGELFVDFYAARGYTSVPGSSLLDDSVPMSFVMSAGLAQVETSARAHDAHRSSRYALVQNCFRYFDLATIGVSDIHLSLFRMPGAFTFGPINRPEMIAQIWQLLTGCYGLPVDRLWVTYFAGDEVAGHRFEPDLDTYNAWRWVGVPAERLVGLSASDNFWKQGASVVGERDAPKCGPNTEVFFDRGAHLRCGPGCRPGCRCGRFVEFLNTLFITYHIGDSGSVRPLDEPFTETVVGLERVAMLLQGASSVYEIDNLQPLVAAVQSFGAPALTRDVPLRYVYVIADHIRALLFLTADGAPPPGRGGRARLMRKLVREMVTAQKLLSIGDYSFYPILVDTVLHLEADQQGRLTLAREQLLAMLEVEKIRFESTLQAGQRRLAQMLARSDGRALSGEAMVTLEKQHGIPFSLLEGMLNAEGVTYRLEDYQRAYAHWRCQVEGVSA